MSKKVDCPCGATMRGDDDDELVTNVQAHVRDEHPEMAESMTREQILAWRPRRRFGPLVGTARLDPKPLRVDATNRVIPKRLIARAFGKRAGGTLHERSPERGDAADRGVAQTGCCSFRREA